MSFGADFRLRHGNELTYYEPVLVDALNDVKCCRVKCVENRTFIITKYGAVIIFDVIYH